MSIFALSSGAGRAGVAVVRISGPEARQALGAVSGQPLPKPRAAALRTLRHPKTQEIFDQALVLWFEGPRSFTGEDVAELHLHGGHAVIDACFDALLSLGLRLAEPGEFTRRAFENGKLDLTEVEGLSDLINAQTAAQRRQALAQAGGALRGRYEAWRSELLRAMAYVEASLDFSDEADIAADAVAAAVPHVHMLISELEAALSDARRGELVRDGVHAAIVGAPNAGKSSLLNALAGREASIVFDEPGTTRDVVEVALDLEGYAIILRDTAGLREGGGAVEKEGIRRALLAAAEADVVLYVRDGAVPDVAAGLLSGEAADGKVIRICNKIDLPGASPNAGELAVSAKTGAGLHLIKERLLDFVRAKLSGTTTALITRARHRQQIEAALARLEDFLTGMEAGAAPELLAQELREAADALGRLTGHLDVEDVLGHIFAEFCIGK